MAVPYTFATATGSLPLSQLDTNFATGIVIGNTTVALGDTITTINNLTLANVTVTSASFSNVTLSGTTTVSGNTTVFSGTGQRIQGDFTTSTITNRPMFQTSTVNGTTTVGAVTNGTGLISNFAAFNNSTGTAASYIAITADSTYTALDSGISAGGTYLPLRFVVGGAEVARFTSSSGFYLIGSTSISTGYDGASWKWVGYQVISRNTAADTNQIVFNNPNGQVGFINTNGTVTSYNSVSDYRLKNNVQSLMGSGAFIDALHPKTWTWAGSSAAGVGFIAHEVAQVSPSSVRGEKDAINDDGSPKYQGMEYGSAEFIANIVAELQSLRARVAALEAA